MEDWEIRLQKVCTFSFVSLMSIGIAWNFLADDFYDSVLHSNTTYYLPEVRGMRPAGCFILNLTSN